MKYSQPYGDGQREIARNGGEMRYAPPTQPSRGRTDSESVSLFEYWDVLRRRKISIFLTCLGCGLLGWLVTLPQTPIYQARTTLELVRQDEAAIGISGQSRDHASQREETAFIRNQVEILQSESLLERVVEKLHLDRQVQEPKKPGLVSRAMALFSAAPTVQPSPKERALKIASKNLTVAIAPDSDILGISYEAPDPDLAAKFANALAEEYIEQTLSVRWELSQRTTEWMTKQLENMKQKLKESERALQAYADSNQLIFTKDTDSVSEDELRQIQDELSKALAERIERQSRFEMASDSPVESLPEVLDDNTLRQYQVDLTNLRKEQASLMASLTPEHYKVKKVQAQVNELEATLERERKRILGRLNTEYGASARREKLLSARYQQQLRLVSNESSKSIQYNLMKREVDTNNDLYQTLMHRVKEAGVNSAIRASTSRIVDPAKPPLGPSKPNILLNTGIGLFAGLFLGVAVAFGRERADRTLRVPGELTFHLRVPELGIIPRFEGLGSGTRNSLAGGKSKGVLGAIGLNGNGNGHEKSPSAELVTWEREPNASAESFRAALTSILFCRGGQPPAVLAFTSPHQGEGKTTVVSNLAVALAEINRRVLVIDGDLRKPRLDRVLGEANGWGLSDLLREPEPLDDRPIDYLVQKTKIPNVHAVFSGRRCANASNLLHSPRLAELIARFRHEFDAVLIDAPPVLGLPDARVLGHLADGVILVLRAGKTTLESAKAARERLGEDGTEVLGTILNDWDPKETRYGQYGHGHVYYEPDPASAQASS